MIPLATPAIVAVRLFLIVGVSYLGAIGTLKLVWMRRVIRALQEHSAALAAHTKQLKKQERQNAAVIAMLTPPEPPSSQTGPQLVRRKNAAIDRVKAESQKVLLEEDNGERAAK